MTKQQKQLLALEKAGRNPKYRPGIKKKIKQIKQTIANNNWLAH